jgi:hypothetical protein
MSEIETQAHRRNTVDRMAEMNRARALEAALSPVEIIQIDSAARVAARQAATAAGKPAPDSSALSLAGTRAVMAARAAKVGAA